jgi:predicted phosphoribosyltransferase
VMDADSERAAAPQRHQRAVVAFLTAGMDPPPSTASMVAALAAARRAVAMHRATASPIDAWLASEVRLRGIRENAAVLAALEMPQHRAEVAESYRNQHPDRAEALTNLLDAMTHPG